MNRPILSLDQGLQYQIEDPWLDTGIKSRQCLIIRVWVLQVSSIGSLRN